jgi:DNA mismatch repair ATPase MutS
VEDPPLSTKQGYLIRTGVSPELDELIELSTHSQALVARMEAEEKEKTGISSLKIRYNNVFGYYIEITNLHKDIAAGITEKEFFVIPVDSRKIPSPKLMRQKKQPSRKLKRPA